eukprot:2534118-Rhodomonas_salina.2
MPYHNVSTGHRIGGYLDPLVGIQGKHVEGNSHELAAAPSATGHRVAREEADRVIRKVRSGHRVARAQADIYRRYVRAGHRMASAYTAKPKIRNYTPGTNCTKIALSCG